MSFSVKICTHRTVTIIATARIKRPNKPLRIEEMHKAKHTMVNYSTNMPQNKKINPSQYIDSILIHINILWS